MRKIFPFAVILFLLFTVSRPANAATTTPDPCGNDAPLSAACPVHADTTNVVIPRSQTKISSFVDSIRNNLLGKQVETTFDWAGILRPSGGYRIGSEKLTNYGQQIQMASETNLKPAELQAVTTPDPQPKKFTMTSVECVHDPQTGAIVKQFPSSERIETGNIPGLTQAIQGSRQLNSYVAGYTQVSQDYNLKNVVVSTDNVSCESPSSGQKVEQSAVVAQNQNSYGPNNVTTSIITTITAAMIAPFQKKYRAEVKQTQPAEIQGKGLTPWIHYVLCLFAGCTSGDVATVSYDSDANKKQLTQAGGAVAAMYKPAAIDDAYKSELNAADPSQQWSLSGAGGQTTGQTQNVLGDQTDGIKATAVNFGQARVTAAGDYANCTIMPADYQNTAVPDGACDTNWVGGSSCNSTTKLSDAPSSACSLCNKDKIKDLVDDKNSVPEGIPPTMEMVLTKAGEAYHVPPSSLLAIMYHEGAFSGSRFVGENAWTEENVNKWSTCGQMPNCDEHGATAQFPYGFFPYYFDGLKDAVLIDYLDRKGKTSLCNFMDVTYAAAKALSVNAADAQLRKYITEPLCFNKPMNVHKVPSSCTDWDENLVFKSHVYYAGYCPQQSVIDARKLKGLPMTNEVVQPMYEKWVVNWYKAFLCK